MMRFFKSIFSKKARSLDEFVTLVKSSPIRVNKVTVAVTIPELNNNIFASYIPGLGFLHSVVLTHEAFLSNGKRIKYVCKFRGDYCDPRGMADSVGGSAIRAFLFGAQVIKKLRLSLPVGIQLFLLGVDNTVIDIPQLYRDAELKQIAI